MKTRLLLCTLCAGWAAPVLAVPVVPNFQQGSMTSHTETTSKVTETINSMDYSTGYQYSATGTGITASGELNVVSPETSTSTVTIDGVTSTWTGVGTKPHSHRQHQEQPFNLQKHTKDLGFSSTQ